MVYLFAFGSQLFHRLFAVLGLAHKSFTELVGDAAHLLRVFLHHVPQVDLQTLASAELDVVTVWVSDKGLREYNTASIRQ